MYSLNEDVPVRTSFLTDKASYLTEKALYFTEKASYLTEKASYLTEIASEKASYLTESLDLHLNPFYHRIHLDALDVVRIAVMSVTIAPIRLIMAGFSLLLAWPIAILVLWGRTRDQISEPLEGWRGVLRPVIVWLCRGVFFWGGFHWVSIKGRQASVKEAPVIAMAPHSSYWDSLFIVYLDMPSVVVKSENENLPIFGRLINFLRPVYVKREDGDSRIGAIKEIKRRCQYPGRYPQVLVYPEGTCTNRTCLISFKGGAFYPGVPVQPICIRYFNKLDTTSWTWDGPGALKVLWLTLCQIHNPVELEFLPVYRPSNEEINDGKLFANNVRALMAESMKLPVSNHTYDDCRLIYRANNNNLPFSDDILNFYKLHEDLGLSFGAVNRLFKRIGEVCKNGCVNVDIAKFAEYLSVPMSAALQDVFDIFDKGGVGHIDLRQYVISLAMISGPESTYEILKMAFFLFAKDGVIALDQMIDILGTVLGLPPEQSTEYFKFMDKNNDGKVKFDEMIQYLSSHHQYTKYFYNHATGDHRLVNGYKFPFVNSKNA